MQAGVYVSLNQVSIIILLFKQFIIHSLHHLVSSMNVSKIQVFQQMIEINGFNTNLYEWKVLSLSLFEWLEKMNMYIMQTYLAKYEIVTCQKYIIS